MSQSFAHRLLCWYDQHGRKALPWHEDRNAYRVWISEIMLQQTQVATVIPYYEAFMARFPNVEALAQADTDEVLQHWSGLGYYARARNLHKAAQQVVAEHSGQFPQDQAKLEALPGIGRSTAAAILAQAWNIRASILDGNVKRVLARYHTVAGWPGQTAVLNQLWAYAEQHTPSERVRDYTQAIMDLGAMVCTRSRPDCEHCPLHGDCQAFRHNTATLYPAPKHRKTLPEKQTWMLLIEDANGHLLMERRPPSGIWGGLWSLPELDPAYGADELEEACQRHFGLRCDAPEHLPGFRHTFSHYHLDIQPVRLSLTGYTHVQEHQERVWHHPTTALTLGLPAPVRKLLSAPLQPELL
ncbi:MAG: A/G-specific adenine glycosylase [Marinobacter sp.]|nr:A/G-specific adenine glycosylase [Marinobacter sp.]